MSHPATAAASICSMFTDCFSCTVKPFQANTDEVCGWCASSGKCVLAKAAGSGAGLEVCKPAETTCEAGKPCCKQVSFSFFGLLLLFCLFCFFVLFICFLFCLFCLFVCFLFVSFVCGKLSKQWTLNYRCKLIINIKNRCVKRAPTCASRLAPSLSATTKFKSQNTLVKQDRFVNLNCELDIHFICKIFQNQKYLRSHSPFICK